MDVSERYSRHEGLFGADGQRSIGASVVGMIGLGGLGMHEAQQLAYAGVRSFRAVEFDLVSESSLNRLVGALPPDVEQPKLQVLNRLVETVQPGAEVRDLSERFDADSTSVKELLGDADVLFSSVDNEVTRVAVLEFASRHGIPLIDAATDVGADESRPWYGGRVVVARGDGCPLCLDVLDQQALAVAQMDDEQRRQHASIYGVSVDALNDTGPSVVSINGVVASLAVTEFLVMCTGLRAPNRLLTYRAERGIVNVSRDAPRPGCPYCSQFRKAVSPGLSVTRWGG